MEFLSLILKKILQEMQNFYSNLENAILGPSEDTGLIELEFGFAC